MGSLYPLPTVIYSSILSNITRSIFPPAFPSALLLALKPLNSGVCSIRSPVEWVNPRGVSHSYGCPEGPPSQGDLRGSSPQRKRDYRGRMVEKRPSTVCVWTGVGLGWRRLRLKTYWIEGPRGRGGGRGGKRNRLGSKDLNYCFKDLTSFTLFWPFSIIFLFAIPFNPIWLSSPS